MDGTDMVELMVAQRKQYDCVLLDQNMTFMSGTEGAGREAAGWGGFLSRLRAGTWASPAAPVCRRLTTGTLSEACLDLRTSAAAERVRAFEKAECLPRTPIIFVSGNNQPADLVAYAAAGGDGIVRAVDAHPSNTQKRRRAGCHPNALA